MTRRVAEIVSAHKQTLFTFHPPNPRLHRLDVLTSTSVSTTFTVLVSLIYTQWLQPSFVLPLTLVSLYGVFDCVRCLNSEVDVARWVVKGAVRLSSRRECFKVLHLTEVSDNRTSHADDRAQELTDLWPATLDTGDIKAHSLDGDPCTRRPFPDLFGASVGSTVSDSSCHKLESEYDIQHSVLWSKNSKIEKKVLVWYIFNTQTEASRTIATSDLTFPPVLACGWSYCNSIASLPPGRRPIYGSGMHFNCLSR